MKNLLYLSFEIPSWIFTGFLIGKGMTSYLGAPDWIMAVTILTGVVIGFIRMIVILKPKS